MNKSNLFKRNEEILFEVQQTSREIEHISQVF